MGVQDNVKLTNITHFKDDWIKRFSEQDERFYAAPHGVEQHGEEVLTSPKELAKMLQCQPYAFNRRAEVHLPAFSLEQTNLLNVELEQLGLHLAFNKFASEMDESRQIVYQVGDIADKAEVKQYYLRCAPKLSIEPYIDRIDLIPDEQRD